MGGERGALRGPQAHGGRALFRCAGGAASARRGGEEGVRDLGQPVAGGLVDDLDGELQRCHARLLGQLGELAGGLCRPAPQPLDEDALGQLDQGPPVRLGLRRTHLAPQPLHGRGQPPDGGDLYDGVLAVGVGPARVRAGAGRRDVAGPWAGQCVLQLQDLAAGRHVDLLRQVALGHRRRHLGDVAHLCGQVAGHGVAGVGQVRPGAGDPRHLRLTAEGALGAHLARHPRDLGGEQGQLVHHAVEDRGDVTEQALAVGRQPGAEVPVPDGGQAGRQLPQLQLARAAFRGLDRLARHAHPRPAPQEPSR